MTAESFKEKGNEFFKKGDYERVRRHDTASKAATGDCAIQQEDQPTQQTSMR